MLAVQVGLDRFIYDIPPYPHYTIFTPRGPLLIDMRICQDAEGKDILTVGWWVGVQWGLYISGRYSILGT